MFLLSFVNTFIHYLKLQNQVLVAKRDFALIGTSYASGVIRQPVVSVEAAPDGPCLAVQSRECSEFCHCEAALILRQNKYFVSEAEHGQIGEWSKL